jgi:hypothetical protein
VSGLKKPRKKYLVGEPITGVRPRLAVAPSPAPHGFIHCVFRELGVYH